jgi:potassium/hydrogen antiporter
MEIAPVIIFVGVLVFLAHFFVALFERTRVPDVLYLILIGLAIGPILHIVRPDDFGKVGDVFTTIALVVILFEGGLELSFESLRRSWRGTIYITILGYFLSLIALLPALYYLTPLSFVSSLFVAAVLAGPAPSVIIPMVRQLRLKDSSRTTLTLESSLGEALCIVIALAVLESFKFDEVRVGRVLGTLVSSFVFAIVIGAVGGYFWSLLLHRMRQLRNAIFTTPSFVFILYGVADFFGFSGPVAALTFGITLGNITFVDIPWLKKRTNLTPMVHNETEKLFFGEIVFVVKTFFFVYIGLSVQFTDWNAVGLALAFTGVLLVARVIAVRFSADKEHTPVHDALRMSVMVPKGTAAAVLAGIPLHMGLEGGALMQNITYGVVIFSIVSTGALVFALDQTKLGGGWFFGGFSASRNSVVRVEPANPDDEEKGEASGSRYL